MDDVVKVTFMYVIQFSEVQQVLWLKNANNKPGIKVKNTLKILTDENIFELTSTMSWFLKPWLILTFFEDLFY